MIIDTAGTQIADEPKIDATLRIIDYGVPNAHTLTDRPTTETRIRIEIRGASSQMFDKKSYGFETVDKHGKDQDLPLLGMPAESDWVLYGPFSDKSLCEIIWPTSSAMR